MPLFLLLVIFLLVSPETVMFGTNRNTYFSILTTLMPVALILYLFEKKNIIQTRYKFLEVVAAFVIPVILSAIINLDFSLTYLFRVILIIAGFMFARKIRIENFLQVFEIAIYYIAIYSVAIYIISRIFPAVLNIFPPIYNTNDLHYYNAIFCVIPSFFSGDWYDRLWGPFREPGVFQMYLNMALLFYIHLYKKLSISRAVVYVVAIILTQSTTGYIVLSFNLLFYVFYVLRRFSFQSCIIVALLCGGFIWVYGNSTLLLTEGNVFYKLTDEGIDASMARIASIWGNIEIFGHNPITGVGYSNMKEMFSSYAVSNYGVRSIDNTNTILYQFASLGVVYGGLFLFSFISFFKRMGNNIITVLFSVTGALLSFMGEDLTGNILIYIILGYGMQYYLVAPKKKIESNV